MLTTRTVDGTTYYQDPADHEMWYTDPDEIGWEGVATATFELPDLLRSRQETLRELREIERDTDDPAEREAGIADWTEQLAVLDREIALLTALL